MYNVSVNIPDEVLYDTHLSKTRSEEYVKRAAALFYYTKLGVSLGYCANIAEMPKIDFIRFLSENGVSIFDYDSQEELIEDIANA
jgi:predicted HTH domain antitoxin